MSDILKPTQCHVRASGEVVVATFGNMSFNYDHETAISIGVDLRMMARRVKYVLDDASRRFTVRGVLHDVNAPRPDTVIAGPVARHLDYDVTAEGSVVKLRLGRTVIGIGYDQALKLAGWFRIAGNDALHNAGDSRRWMAIKNVDDAAERATEMIVKRGSYGC